MTDRIRVAIEATPRRVFATAIDWPGWSRSGKTEPLALESLADQASRYAAVARAAGVRLPDGAADATTFEIVEGGDGGAGTDFGVPSRVTDADRRPVSRSEAARLGRLVAAAWAVFDRVAAVSPAELRKGPRGGGRDRDRIVDHVVEADHAYAREIGLRLPPPSADDRPAIEAMRMAMLELIRAPSEGSTLAGRRWTTRYAAGRVAWHALDHAWEIEDRAQPS